MSRQEKLGLPAFRIRGGVHAPHRKNTAECETVVMPPPERIVVAMSQHIGAPCIPVVKVGDTVKVGQLTAIPTPWYPLPSIPAYRARLPA